MIPRGQLYISNSELLTGIFYCFTDGLQAQKTDFEYQNGKTLTCLSVRTAFDLVLTSLNFPAGSEILVTDINIPDMFKIMTAHHLVPIPLPVNKNTLSISAEQLESAITSTTKAILITHLFGAIMDTDEVNAIAQKHNIFVFEDCAQAYAGNLYEGSPATDVSMFSFGLIKTNTAVRGAIVKIKDPILYADVLSKNGQYPEQRTREFLHKLLKVISIKVLTTKIIYTVFYKLINASGKDFDNVLASLTKGFPNDQLLRQIRYRPSLANKKLLQHKMLRFKQDDIDARIQLANDILQNIPDHYKIGTLNKRHTHWVLPIETQDPNGLIHYLLINGFDASQKASSLIKQPGWDYIPAQDDLTLENLVYLPVYPAMSTKDRNRLTQLLNSFKA
ncbi:DegT/DnrJ/EryC1/StrS family aminotransferase [Sphingobacterium sp. SYP-B4668]|uniref:DegT/DnrJ/EryC1/StrS family aminotransferase n=1 Tax=Sphingobacterium sp. SYP-B4668 TaxID=2996035 RepID=UPI0022DDEBD4|nr:DegT/DnrJ/EryC1/StrS family aminotransferase [Sphingobacterium sp. SYP-B4668]